MSVVITLSEQTAKHLSHLSVAGAQDDDGKVRALLEVEYRQQMAHASRIDQALRDKYQLTFEEFQNQNTVAQRGYTWDVEADAAEWEFALSSWRTARRQLTELLGKISDEEN